jgi:hypothetical protein
MVKQITLEEMIKECEDEQNTEEISRKESKKKTGEGVRE